MCRNYEITTKTVFTLHALHLSASIIYSVSLERPSATEWEDILRHIAKPVRDYSRHHSSFSESSEESEPGRYEQSNRDEIALRNKSSCRIRRSRKKTVYSIIRNMPEQSRLDWDNGEGFCEVSCFIQIKFTQFIVLLLLC